VQLRAVDKSAVVAAQILDGVASVIFLSDTGVIPTDCRVV